MCVSDRYTKIPDKPHHLLLVGGEPSEHQLRRDVQPSCHHAVEEGTLHHFHRGNSQHTSACCRGQVCAGGGSTQMIMFVEGKLTMSSCSSFVKPVKAVNENNYVLLEGSLAALSLFANVLWFFWDVNVIVFILIWGDSHVGPGLWPLQLHSQEQHWHAIPGIHSCPGRWVYRLTTDNHICGLISTSRNEWSQGSFTFWISNCSTALSLLTLMALFAILRKINSTTTPNPYSVSPNLK